MSCLDDETVAAFVLGDLPGEKRATIERHLSGCAACTTLVAEYGKFFFQTHEPSSRSIAAPAAALDAGTAVSRYLVIRLLGRGGAADVYEAWDPKLKRKVALKLLRTLTAPDVAPAEAEARLLREAEAMARLAHPNVVAVHDAGTFGDRVFIVMELVDGETLGEWLRRQRRDSAAILALFTAAGRGLEAAHAAEIVHRDFKPDNVLVGRDGRARVTDFGLARADALPDAPGERDPTATLAGGTPLFMAPEQHRGAPATARSDQWSFCLALARALCGRDPFGAEARRAWARKGEEPQPPPITLPGVPAALARALTRGLAQDPDRRFPSMAALLREIEAAAGPVWPLRSRPTAAAAGVVLVVIGLGGWLVRRAQAPAECGNGIVEPGEECDERTAACSQWCVRCDGGDARFSWAHTGACYERFDRPLPWTQAAQACAKRGAGLVSFSSAPEATAVADALLPSGVESWIGLRRSGNGLWAWSSGDAWADPLPGFWGEVDKPAGRDCVLQRRALADKVIRIPAVWPTASCREPRGFLCERAPWRRFERTGHAFRAVPVEDGWEGAKAACRRMGAHLATISDADENTFLTTHLTVPVWLGARQQLMRSPFSWVTGEPFSFARFAPGEPDLGQMPACIVLGVDELWHDRPCSSEHPYLCEME